MGKQVVLIKPSGRRVDLTQYGVRTRLHRFVALFLVVLVSLLLWILPLYPLGIAVWNAFHSQ